MQGQRTFLVSKMSRPSLGPTQPTTLSLGLKRAESEVNTSPTSSTKIKNRWSYNLPPLSLLHITPWHAEEELCFWGLINRNRGRYFRNAGSVDCDYRLVRRVSENTSTNKNSYSLSKLQFRAFTLWPMLRPLVSLLWRCGINVATIVSTGVFNTLRAGDADLRF